MATFRLQFTTDNAAFDELPGVEIATILQRLSICVAAAPALQPGDECIPLHDTNGNRVGEAEYV